MRKRLGPTQAELEDQLTAKTSEVRKREKVPGMHKNLLETPSDEVPSGEVIAVMTDTLEANHELLGWHEGWAQPTADSWARIILRDIRFGVPTSEVDGLGFKIHEVDLGNPPLCDDCEEV